MSRETDDATNYGFGFVRYTDGKAKRISPEDILMHTADAPPAPAAGWDAERLAVVIQHAIYCSPYDALCAAKEVVSAFPRPTAPSAEAMREAAAKECERHAEFMKGDAHAGGNWKHLMTRVEEALYNAQRIRRLPLPPAQPAGETGDDHS